MARLGRYFIKDQPLHVIQRGNDRASVRNAVRYEYHNMNRRPAGSSLPVAALARSNEWRPLQGNSYLSPKA